MSSPQRTTETSLHSKENILIAITGLSPAVLTETIYALAHQESPIIPDRIIVVTTVSGRERIQEQLFASGAWTHFVAHLQQVTGISMKNKLRFGPADDCLRVFPNHSRSHSLDDIRTQEESDTVAEYLMETVRSFSEDADTRIIASIAGGRKTTSALFHSVMTLIGRGDDLITHILVNEPWERVPGFLYPGCPGDFYYPGTNDPICSHDARLCLAILPFVPLRYLFQRDINQTPGSYIKLMHRLRSRAIESNQTMHLRLDCTAANIHVGKCQIALSPREFCLYYLFASFAANNQRNLASVNDILSDGVDILEKTARTFLPSDNLSHWSHRVSTQSPTEEDDVRKLLSAIRRKMRQKGLDQFQVNQLVPRRGQPYINLPHNNISIQH